MQRRAGKGVKATIVLSVVLITMAGMVAFPKAQKILVQGSKTLLFFGRLAPNVVAMPPTCLDFIALLLWPLFIGAVDAAPVGNHTGLEPTKANSRSWTPTKVEQLFFFLLMAVLAVLALLGRKMIGAWAKSGWEIVKKVPGMPKARSRWSVA